MRPIVLSGMTALLLLCASCGGARYPVYVPGNSAESLNNALNSVVALVEVSGDDMEGPYCTGFFISETDLITAGHCVLEEDISITFGPDGPEIALEFEDPEAAIGREIQFINIQQFNEWVGTSEEERSENPEYMTARVLAVVDPDEGDMALLRLSNNEPHSTHWLPVRDWTSEGTPSVGEEVYALGMPVGEPWVLTRGIISRMHIELDNQVFIFHDARIGPGSSGSPLLDVRGNVIGVNTQISRNNIFSKATPSTIIHTLYRLHEARREIEELDRTAS